MKIDCLMGTYGRYSLACEALVCFLQQSVGSQASLLIYNHHPIPLSFDHPRVRVVNEAPPPGSLRHLKKRMLELADPDAELIHWWDDDDLYLPWHLEDCLRHIGTNVAWKPASSWMSEGNVKFSRHANRFEASWIFRATYLQFARLDTHPDYIDHPVFRQTEDAGLLASTELEGRTSYVYRWDTGTEHVSGYGGSFSEEQQRDHLEMCRLRSNDIRADGRLIPADMSLRWRQYLDGIKGQVSPLEWKLNRQALGYVMPLPRRPVSWVHLLKLKLSEIGALPIISAALTWFVLAPRLVPTNDFDRGIFVSVAERLLAGDILYAQVYDNKEPFFYYFVAGQRWIGPIAEFLAELLLFVVAAASAYSIACRLASKRAAFAIAFVAIPIILTGAFYWAGYTHLPGISLCLAAFALSLRGRLAAAGVALGLLAFTKLIMLPMALALVMCALAFEQFLPAIRLWISLVLTLVVGSTLLMIRSEFYPFLDVMRLNFTYSHNQLVASFADRFQMLASENLTVILLSIVVGMLVALLARSPNDRALTLMGSATLIALTLALLTLALAGVWNHHAQILYVPAALVAISLAPRLVTALNQSQAVLAVLLVVCFSLLLGGVTNLRSVYGQSISEVGRQDFGPGVSVAGNPTTARPGCLGLICAPRQK